MYWIKGHFDGKAVVIDEPVTLAVGQAVRIVVDPVPSLITTSPHAPFGPHRDSIAELMNGEPFDERDVLNAHTPDEMPPGFVRQPGSGAGEIWMADDFDEIPEDFKDYV